MDIYAIFVEKYWVIVNFFIYFAGKIKIINQNHVIMKRFYTTLAMAFVVAIASFAQMLPQGITVPYTGIKRNTANFSKDNVLVTVPETAVIETDWAIDGIYYYGENNIPYVNDNPISVAFDGNDIYFRGMVFTCPNAWIKGTMVNNVVRFANGQFCGTYSNYNIYACGSSDAVNFSDILFQYDPNEKTFTLASFYIENTTPNQQQFILFSYNLVLYKDLQVPAPTDLTVVPDVNSAEVSWTSDAGNYNLRYRKYVDMSGTNRFWDFEDEDQAAEFTLVDADGDGKGWAWIDSKVKAHSGNCIMYSASYDSSTGALTPDNWIITPKVKLGGQVSFWACAQENNTNYASEKFQVYVFEGDEWTSVDDFIAVSDIYTTTINYQQVVADLSDFEGNGYIAIRHFNCTDQFWLNIDDVEVIVPDASDAVQPEWIVCNDVSNPYTISNLEPETEYEVQVCAIEEGVTSPWTQSAVFTTIPEGGVVPTIDELYLVGSFNGWNWQNEEGRVPFTLENDMFTVDINLEEGDEFKLITPDETSESGWRWFGGVDENNVGFFLINDGLLDVNIDLVDGSNFRVEDVGNYTITVMAHSEDGKGVQEPLVMFVHKEATGISTVGVDVKADNAYYYLLGVKFNTVPTIPGIYIHNGKKVVIRM